MADAQETFFLDEYQSTTAFYEKNFEIKFFDEFLAHFLQGVRDLDDFAVDGLEQVLELRFRVEDLDVLGVRVVADAERSGDRLSVGTANNDTI